MAAIFICGSINLVTMTASRTFDFGIRAFDLKIRVASNSEKVRYTLERFLLPPFMRCDVPDAAADVVVKVWTAAAGFEISVDNVKVASGESLADAALAAVKALDDALIRKLRVLRAVHAGAVVLHGRALLVPGLSHAGKSSLVAELLRRGAAHLSDEYALIDQDGRVHAYPRPLLLRDGRPRQTLLLPGELKASFALEPMRIGWILGVEYDPGAFWKISRISQSEAVMLLLSNTPHEMGQSPEMVDLFTRCVVGAECYTGTRGDVVEAADRILELVTK